MGASESAFAEAIRVVASAVDQLASAVIATGDAEAIARSASLLEGCRGELAMVVDTLKKAIPPLLPGRAIAVEHLGLVEVHSSTRRTGWQKPRMQSRAVGLIADEHEIFFDPKSGEQRPQYEIARRVIERFLDFFSLGQPKLSGWRAEKIDPDQYADVERGKSTVQLPSRKGRSPGEIIGDDDA